MAEREQLLQAMSPTDAPPGLQTAIANLGHAWELVRRGVEYGLLDDSDRCDRLTLIQALSAVLNRPGEREQGPDD